MLKVKKKIKNPNHSFSQFQLLYDIEVVTA